MLKLEICPVTKAKQMCSLSFVNLFVARDLHWLLTKWQCYLKYLEFDLLIHYLACNQTSYSLNIRQKAIPCQWTCKCHVLQHTKAWVWHNAKHAHSQHSWHCRVELCARHLSTWHVSSLFLSLWYNEIHTTVSPGLPVCLCMWIHMCL